MMSIGSRSPGDRSSPASILVLVSGLSVALLSAAPGSLHAQKPDLAYISPSHHDPYQAAFCSTIRDKQSQQISP